LSNRIVIIPTYNEKENIEKMIRKVFSLADVFSVLIVDDSSPDGTGEIVKSLQKEFPLLHLLSRAGKEGLGKAYLAGFQWALDHQYEYIFEMDCDFSHNPDDLIRLYNACANEGADVAIGSRYVTGVNVVNWPMSRVMLSFFGSVYVRFISRMKIQDTTAGFKCYKSTVLNTFNFDKIRFKGYGFQIEMKYVSWKLGFKLKEVPIIFTDRTEGTSKISGNIMAEALLGVIRLKLSSVKRYKKSV
jgi:dolichol-phosphate mannosyltransferase